jgi:uncharacterized membrane protein YsdA (DUF1294 family)
MNAQTQTILIYLGLISLFAVIFTVYDKIAAKCGARRIPEKTLFTISAFGGAVAMYLTMITIRHKTKHKSFMIGIPAIIVAHVIIAILAIILLF